VEDRHVIHLDRIRVPPPSSLSGTRAQTAYEAAEEFFGRPAAKRRQLRFRFDADVYASPEVFEALNALFLSKCAFCESAVFTTAQPEAVHLRPPQNSLSVDGAVASDHYWWLAYEWENLYLTCPSCALARGTRFPVAGKRVGAPTRGAGLGDEYPLLLDPCRDNPEQHLLYLEDGSVASDDERGRTTIQMFNLNRAALVEARRRMRLQLLNDLSVIATAAPGEIEPLMDPAHEFAGMRRQLVVERLGRQTDIAPQVRVESRSAKAKVGKEFAQIRAEQEDFALEPTEAATPEAYYTHARQVERIQLRNWRIIEELDLAIDPEAAALSGPGPAPDAKQRAPWLMLLGENGLGKSTVLQAVCLALLDEKTREGLGLDASDFVRSGTRRASVKVHLSGTPEPIELIARKGQRNFEGGSSLKALLLGYGATRLLPTPKHPAKESTAQDVTRVENLFDPFTPIGDSTAWLLGLEQRRFDEVALGLRQLLMLGDDERLVRDHRNGRVLSQGRGARVQLEVLSAGYQSVIALATDVMKVVLSVWESPTVAEGIVVVDELGAHLHPRWRMRIVEALRTVFPRMQVIASTHDPLCLRGLGDGEVVVLRRNSEGRVVALDDLPPPNSMRVDQLLSSEHFGLGSTVDPALDELFAEYYLLKAKRRPDAREKSRLDELHAELDGRELVGTTRRERLIYEATDEYLAHEVDVTDHDERVQLKEETKELIRAAWRGD
jgi:uncharacterized protein (TIGR02646 family)